MNSCFRASLEDVVPYLYFSDWFPRSQLSKCFEPQGMKCVRLIMYNRILMVASTQISFSDKKPSPVESLVVDSKKYVCTTRLSCVLMWFGELRNMKNIMTAVVDDRLIRWILCHNSVLEIEMSRNLGLEHFLKLLLHEEQRWYRFPKLHMPVVEKN